MNLAKKANALETRTNTSPWTDHEHIRGYAVMMLPFSSGDLLGLRVWPESDFAPYVSVWYRSSDGEWSMFSDGHSLETTCPRYWQSVIQRAELINIDITWTDANELRVEMDEPQLVWTMSMTAPPLLRGINAMSAELPLWSWRPGPLLRLREWMAKRLLGLGDISLSFTTPSGHETVIMPEEIYFIDDSEAVLDGRSLGEPVQLEENPLLGDVPWPIRPSFGFGQAHMRITDPEEYHRTRERVHGESHDSTAPQPESA